MTAELEKVVSALERSLTGKGAHVEMHKILDRLDWKSAGLRPGGAPHSVFQLAKHIIFWQDWVINWLDGKKPPIPKHAAGSWEKKSGPASSAEWKQTVQRVRRGLEELKRRSATDLLKKQGQKSRLEMLQTIASHNSYHAGQVVLLRQILGRWPLRSGGLTW
jgi:uncharacterized damage-inducible protein DinB